MLNTHTTRSLTLTRDLTDWHGIQRALQVTLTPGLFWLIQGVDLSYDVQRCLRNKTQREKKRGRQQMRQNRTKSRSPPLPDYFDHECLLEAISSQSFLLDILRSMAWVSDP